MIGAFSSVIESPQHPYKLNIPIKHYIDEENNSDDSDYDYVLKICRYERIYEHIYERVLTDKETIGELLYDCVSNVVSQHNRKSIKWSGFTVHDTYSEHEYDRASIQVDMRNWIVKASAHTNTSSSSLPDENPV